MKILLTGATGFIGSRLLERLIKAYGFDSITVVSSKPIEGVRTHVIASRKYFALDADLSDIDVLIHAGAFTPKSGSQANDAAGCNGNINFTEQLLSLGLEKLSRIIHLSTLDVYAEAPIISEQTLVAPASLYGLSKYYCEQLTRFYAAERRVSHTVLRIGHVYGPGEEVYSKLLPTLIRRVINKQAIDLWGTGEELRSFIHVDDVCTSVLNAIDQDIPLVNVVSGTAISVNQLVDKVMELGDGVVPINRRDAGVTGRSFVFDNSLLKACLLSEERDFDTALSEEYHYMEQTSC